MPFNDLDDIAIQLDHMQDTLDAMQRNLRFVDVSAKLTEIQRTLNEILDTCSPWRPAETKTMMNDDSVPRDIKPPRR